MQVRESGAELLEGPLTPLLAAGEAGVALGSYADKSTAPEGTRRSSATVSAMVIIVVAVEATATGRGWRLRSVLALRADEVAGSGPCSCCCRPDRAS
ncbi:MAG: hypothetical protein WKF82_13545 [Nocardioidaceae bacterium]